MSIKLKYNPKTGLVEESGSGFEISTGINISNGMDVSRNVTFTTSLETGVSETSGSILQLKGKSEGIHFHVGGNQYISSNAWFDASRDLTPESAAVSGMWVYEKDNSAAFRWGFRDAVGCFDLDFAIQGMSGTPVTGSMWHPTSGSWGTGLSLSASNGAVTIGKKADRSNVKRWNDSGLATIIQHGANAMFDVTGSVGASTSARSLAVAVTGSVEFGCGAPDAFFLLPRLTTTQRDALTAVNGMVVYNTSDDKFQGYQDGSWQNLI